METFADVLEQVLLIISLAGGYAQYGIEPAPTNDGCKNWQESDGPPPALEIGAHCYNNEANDHPLMILSVLPMFCFINIISFNFCAHLYY